MLLFSVHKKIIQTAFFITGCFFMAGCENDDKVLQDCDTISVEFPNKLHCDFYDDSTQLETWLDSKYGIYYENLNKVYLRDSVVVITVKGDTLKSPDLWWDQSTKMFYTDKYATYHGVGKNIYGGKGMEATQDLKRIMFKETTGNLKVSENGFPQ